MRRGMAIAALFAALLALPAWGQRRGGGGGFSGRSASGFRGPTFAGRPSGFIGSGRFGTGFRTPGFLPNRYGRAGFVRGYPWVYPYVYPYVGDYSFYPGYDYGYGYPAPPDYNSSASYGDTTAQIQQGEIDRLENEVDRLHEERASVPQPPAKSEAEPATLLIFQDKHREEVRNYAIVGPTLWIFTDVKARKIPLANLDVSATTKANDDRGVDFRLP